VAEAPDELARQVLRVSCAPPIARGEQSLTGAETLEQQLGPDRQPADVAIEPRKGAPGLAELHHDRFRGVHASSAEPA
jgi:hypothetical protein